MLRATLALLMLAPPAYADQCFHQRHVGANVILSTGQVITPYVVPVAVPVGVVSQGYAYQRAMPQAAPAAVDPAEWEEFKAWKASKVTPAAAASLVTQSCASCHTKQARAVKALDLNQPLTDKQRIAAAAAVLAGRMPKGKPIDAKLRGDILGELMGVDAEPTPAAAEPSVIEPTPPPAPTPAN